MFPLIKVAKSQTEHQIGEALTRKYGRMSDGGNRKIVKKSVSRIQSKYREPKILYGNYSMKEFAVPVVQYVERWRVKQSSHPSMQASCY